MSWTHKTAAEATQGKAQGQWNAARVEIDSRKIKPGDLFVALKGDHFDGHDYVKDALAKGAVAAIVKRVPKGVAADAPLLKVKDTQAALDALGQYARERSRAKIIGVTGSVGKTSAKEMLKLALSAHGKTFATSGNYNNHIGTPLNLANLPPDAEFAVFEMGMNHAGEIAHLTRMVQPDIAVITAVEAVHAEFFDSVEDIARAKSEIFSGMLPEGIAVLPADSPYLPVMIDGAGKCGVTHAVTFGEHDDADCRLISYRATALGSDVTASIHSRPVSYMLGAIGKHWAVASLMTLAVTHALGLDDLATAHSLLGFYEIAGRGRMHRIAIAGGDAMLIDDSYNASPVSMRAAFAKTAEVWQVGGGKGRKLAALGDMLELGEGSVDAHAALAEALQQAKFDTVFTAGALMKHLNDALPPPMRGVHAAKAADLLSLLSGALKAGDVLLIKGSHGSKMYELADALMHSKNPREKVKIL